MPFWMKFVILPTDILECYICVGASMEVRRRAVYCSSSKERFKESWPVMIAFEIINERYSIRGTIASRKRQTIQDLRDMRRRHRKNEGLELVPRCTV